MALWGGQSGRDRAKVSVDGVRMPRDCRSSASVWSGANKVAFDGTTGTTGRARALAEPARLMNPTAPDAPRARWHTEHAVGLSCRLIGPRCTDRREAYAIRQALKVSSVRRYHAIPLAKLGYFLGYSFFARALSYVLLARCGVRFVPKLGIERGRGRGTTNSARICR